MSISVSSSSRHRWLVVPGELTDEPSRELVGGKAWSLWRMRSLGLRVPPAFVITTEACGAYFAGGRGLPDGLPDELTTGIRRLERELDQAFGGAERPLLVSVRSGAAVSMPGMMDTILNLGMNEATEAGLAAETGDPAFAGEVHRRFCAFYGRLVLGATEALDELDSTAAVRAALRDDVGEDVPSDPWEQLPGAVAAVFESSRSRRALAYRRHYGIPDDLGTAVTVQAMVFGNLDERSGTGVLFSRNPIGGERAPYGEYLPRGQGEDVVSGQSTPHPLDYLAQRDPPVHAELTAAAERLDTEGRDAQDIEFTVQRGTLYLLQSRPAKRTARAAARVAIALVNEGVLTPHEATRRVSADQVRSLLRPQIEPSATEAATVIATGTPASPGAATGLAVATPEEAQQVPGAILVRRTTSPDDVHGMLAAAAVVTELGGSTSHAAVVSRALDTPCVVGCGEGTVTKLAGRTITVDATAGRVFAGELPTMAVSEDEDPDLRRLAEWAQECAEVAVIPPTADCPAPMFDADAAAAATPADSVPAIPTGTRSVRGAVFGTDAGVCAALEAGVRVIAATQRLPALLAAAAHDGGRS
jgi:pyruvate,orthophosphate dikinase